MPVRYRRVNGNHGEESRDGDQGVFNFLRPFGIKA